MHELLQEKFYGWEEPPGCPRCHHPEREFEVSPARIARGKRRAHGGKLGYRCLKCGHFQPMVLARHKAL